MRTSGASSALRPNPRPRIEIDSPGNADLAVSSVTNGAAWTWTAASSPASVPSNNRMDARPNPSTSCRAGSPMHSRLLLDSTLTEAQRAPPMNSEATSTAAWPIATPPTDRLYATALVGAACTRRWGVAEGCTNPRGSWFPLTSSKVSVNENGICSSDCSPPAVSTLTVWFEPHPSGTRHETVPASAQDVVSHCQPPMRTTGASTGPRPKFDPSTVSVWPATPAEEDSWSIWGLPMTAMGKVACEFATVSTSCGLDALKLASLRDAHVTVSVPEPPPEVKNKDPAGQGWPATDIDTTAW